MRDSSKLPDNAIDQYKKEVDKGVRKRDFMEGRLHIFVHMKAAIFSAGEGCQLLFSLWNKKNHEFVSDEFMVALTAAGMPDDISLMEKLYTLFVDLTKSDFEQGLVLVCRIYRIGKLTSEDKASSSSGMMAMGNAAAPISDDRQIYKRHFGCSCLDLTELNVHKLLIGEELNPENIPIYQPRNGNEWNFSNIHVAISEGRKEEVRACEAVSNIANRPLVRLAKITSNATRYARRSSRLCPRPTVSLSASLYTREISRLPRRRTPSSETSRTPFAGPWQGSSTM